MAGILGGRSGIRGADVPSLEAILVEEHDPHVNALGIKGVGEIGIYGRRGSECRVARHRSPRAQNSRLRSIA
jgi:hypothetical protein